MVIFIKNFNIINLKLLNLFIIGSVIIFISIMVYKSVENYYKKEEYEYFLEKCYHLKNKILNSYLFINTNLNTDYFILKKYIINIQRL